MYKFCNATDYKRQSATILIFVTKHVPVRIHVCPLMLNNCFMLINKHTCSSSYHEVSVLFVWYVAYERLLIIHHHALKYKSPSTQVRI